MNRNVGLVGLPWGEGAVGKLLVVWGLQAGIAARGWFQVTETMEDGGG
jgi:hypothetical protein